MTFDADRLVALLRDRLPPGVPLQLPPPCLTDMQGEPLAFEDGSLLRMRFPVLARYQNPLGYMQGGFIAAALDNTLGPFSYLIAPPSVTVRMAIDYLRPVLPSETAIVCEARLVERTAKSLFLSATVAGSNGKTVALCQSVCQLVA